MSPDTAPGGPPPYNLGMTTVHEVGHWLGLLHPFNFDPDKFGPNTPQGCADTAGDHIFDTPAEKNASFGCQVVNSTSDNHHWSSDANEYRAVIAVSESRHRCKAETQSITIWTIRMIDV